MNEYQVFRVLPAPAAASLGSPMGTFLERSMFPVEYCSAVGTIGDIFLADWAQCTLIEKGGVDVQSSMKVQFIYGESVLRFTFRNN